MITLDVEQGSEAWLMARLGLPTASQFHRVLTPKTGKLSAQATGYRNLLLAEHVLGYPLDNAGSAFMERGTDLEAEAKSFYELQRDTDIQRVGFCLTDDRRTGCSPDGFVGADGLVEIKCPSIQVHIGHLLDGAAEDDHRCQAQGQLWVTGRAWLDLVVYSPVLPSLIVRVERDEEFIAKLAQAVGQFCDWLEHGRRELARRGVVGKVEAPPERVLKLA